jgi:hypothetical protein
MKYIRLLLAILLSFVTIHSYSQNQGLTKKEKKEIEYQKTKKMVERGFFIFYAEWLVTHDYTRVLVRGDGLLFENDKVTADLPFVGESQASEIGEAVRIEFVSHETPFDIRYNDKKRKILMKFDTTYHSEIFSLTTQIMGSGKTQVRITSSGKKSISYEGYIKPSISNINPSVFMASWRLAGLYDESGNKKALDYSQIMDMNSDLTYTQNFIRKNKEGKSNHTLKEGNWKYYSLENSITFEFDLTENNNSSKLNQIKNKVAYEVLEITNKSLVLFDAKLKESYVYLKMKNP